MFTKEHKRQMKVFKYTGETPPEVTPEPVDVFVDIIIGFLEKPTAYMRTVGNQVFSLLSGAVEESTIDLILSVCRDTFYAVLINPYAFYNSNWTISNPMNYKTSTRTWRLTRTLRPRLATTTLSS